MPLYRRVFPPFYERTWNPNVKDPNVVKFDRDEEETKDAEAEMTD